MSLTYCSCDTEQSCNVKVQKVHPHSNDRQSHEPDSKNVMGGGVLPKFNFPSSLSHTDCTQHPPTQISTQNEA